MFKCYSVNDFEHKHEINMFERIVQSLQQEFEHKNEFVCLIANFVAQAREIDAVLIKEQAIIILELKSYEGHIYAHELEDWRADKEIVKGGSNSKNPFIQVWKNRFALINYLSKHTEIGQTQSNLYHTSGVVIFRKCHSINESGISCKAKKWFHITDLDGLIEKIKSIKSDKIHLAKSSIQKFIDSISVIERDFSKSAPHYKVMKKELFEKKPEIGVSQTKDIYEKLDLIYSNDVLLKRDKLPYKGTPISIFSQIPPSVLEELLRDFEKYPDIKEKVKQFVVNHKSFKPIRIDPKNPKKVSFEGLAKGSLWPEVSERIDITEHNLFRFVLAERKHLENQELNLNEEGKKFQISFLFD